MERLNAFLKIVPILIVGYVLYLGWQHWDWLNSPGSALGQKRAALVSAKQQLTTVQGKVKAAEEFYRQLESLRARIRELAAQLENSKSSLSAEIDIANFVRMVTLEAKKLGLVIKGIKPETDSRKEFYVEVPFLVAVKGAYVQLLVFFDRIAKFQQVIRVSEFQMRPSGTAFQKYVELEASAKLVTYKYVGTEADEIGKDGKGGAK